MCVFYELVFFFDRELVEHSVFILFFLIVLETHIKLQILKAMQCALSDALFKSKLSIEIFYRVSISFFYNERHKKKSQNN